MAESATSVELHVVTVENPEDLNLILGQSHFIKTVEDLHEALAGAVPGLQFGIAFCESSGPRLVRRSATIPSWSSWRPATRSRSAPGTRSSCSCARAFRSTC